MIHTSGFVWRYLALPVLAILMTATTLAVVQVVEPVPASAAAAAGSQPPGKWKCGRWKNHGGVGWRHCAKFSVFEQKFDVDFRRTFFNKSRKRTVPFTCTTEKHTTWTFYAEGTVKAEAGVIFAKAEASATMGVQRSETTVDGASSTIRVGPRKWAHCERGMYTYNFRGWVKKQTCDSSGCTWGTLKSFTGRAPSREAFMIGPGRG